MRRKTASRGRAIAASVALFAALISVSCGGMPSQKATSNAGGLTANTSSLDFGSVAVGSSKKQSVTLVNSTEGAGAPITISQIGISGSGFSAAKPALPLTLAAGQSANISVTFAPKSAGTLAGNLTIQIAGSPEAAEVGLAGTAVGSGQLLVAPGTMAFGNMAVGSSKSLNGTLTAGASDVTVSSAAWNGQGYAVGGIDFPVTVAAGKSISFVVTFSPQVAGNTPGNISFVSNAPNSPTSETLSGAGAATQGSQHSVSLSWDASTSPVAGYNIYRATQEGGPYSRLNAGLQPRPAFVDNNVDSGLTYYYVATSVDGSSIESGYSNESVATIPSP